MSKKKLLSLLFIMILAFSISACGQKDPDIDANNEQPAVEEQAAIEEQPSAEEQPTAEQETVVEEPKLPEQNSSSATKSAEDKAAADKAAADKAAADKAAADKAAADKAAADKAAADKAAADKAAADKAAADKAAADKAAADKAAADKAAADKADTHEEKPAIDFTKYVGVFKYTFYKYETKIENGKLYLYAPGNLVAEMFPTDDPLSFKVPWKGKDYYYGFKVDSSGNITHLTLEADGVTYEAKKQ